MNREQKLALIIGFAVILIVGVLVSDHLSAAQHVKLADATEGDTGRIEARPVALLPDPAQPDSRYAAGETHLGPEQGPGPIAGAGLAPSPEDHAQTPDVVRITMGPGRPLGEALDQVSTQRPGGDESAKPISRLREFGERLAQGFGDGLQPATRLDDESASAPAAQDATVLEVPAPRTTRHTVAKNESLYKIAGRYLGDGNRWREIAAANPKSVDADGGVREGVTLVIPGVDAPAERRTAPPRREEPRTYIVAKNDSLGKIAQEQLGSVRYMDELIKANAGLIDDPDDIRVGMVLTLPTRS